jgi:hypothetical protein
MGQTISKFITIVMGKNHLKIKQKLVVLTWPFLIHLPKLQRFRKMKHPCKKLLHTGG